MIDLISRFWGAKRRGFL